MPVSTQNQQRCGATEVIDLCYMIHLVSAEQKKVKLECFREDGHDGDHCALHPTEMFGTFLWPSDLG